MSPRRYEPTPEDWLLLIKAEALRQKMGWPTRHLEMVPQDQRPALPPGEAHEADQLAAEPANDKGAK